jgi:hypothetical protein
MWLDEIDEQGEVLLEVKIIDVLEQIEQQEVVKYAKCFNLYSP